MGCIVSLILSYTKYDDLGVTGFAASALEIIEWRKAYIEQEHKLLKLREKCWLDDDDMVIESDIGRRYLTLKGDSKSKERSLIGLEGVPFAGYVLDRENDVAHITKEINKKTLVHASIRRSGRISRKPGIDVFVHHAPVNIENVSLDGMRPEIYIRGEFAEKKYSFLMPDGIGFMKIAEALPEFEGKSEKGHYFINVGPRIDIAFVGLTGMIIDEMFS